MKTTSSRPFSQALDRLRTAGLRPTRQRLGLARLLFDGRRKFHYLAVKEGSIFLVEEQLD